MEYLLKMKSGKKHHKEIVIDFTDKKFKKFNSSVIKYLIRESKKFKKLKVIDKIFLLKELGENTIPVSDHINLSGFNPLQGPQFIPLTDIYKTKKTKKNITIVGLKEGVVPNKHEVKKLKNIGISAYSYNLIPTVIIGVSLGYNVEAFGVCS